MLVFTSDNCKLFLKNTFKHVEIIITLFTLGNFVSPYKNYLLKTLT